MNTPHGPLPDPSTRRRMARRRATWAEPWVSVMALALLSTADVRAQDRAQEKAKVGAGLAPTRPVPATNAAPSRPVGSADPVARRLLLVRASPVPLGENSVLSVGAGEAKEELKGLEGGLFRRTVSEPRVLSVAEQGGWVRGFFKEPKASRLWSFFNPRAPVDSESDLLRSARIFGIRGDAPLPTSQVDPIHVEPVGIRFWQISR